ncbi:MAG: 50S ribosomal protein L25 [Saprospiraceae bacterium]|jgi:large subunit ribosomal protein L25|nr:50S ribosomal protein L25 [Saprospiraceae bacterium]
MEVVAIKGQGRSGLGKKATKAVRNDGRIPCVIYGGGDAIHFTTTGSEVKNLVYSGDFKLAEIDVDGKPHKCILKDIQFHPVNDKILHIDFLRLVDGHPVKVEVPLRFKGVSAGVKAGGKLLQTVRKVKIKTTPEHLVDELSVDITHLEMGQSIRIRDIKPATGIEIINSPGIPIATIEIPRALRSAATTAEKKK